MDVADDSKSEERCELPRGREQVNAEENLGESHAVDYPEDEISDSCSETDMNVDWNCLEKIKTTPRPTTKSKVRSFFRLLGYSIIEMKFHHCCHFSAAARFNQRRPD